MIMGAHQSNPSAGVTAKEVKFEHFQIVRAIGKGSFGKVCIVQKKKSRQNYAMKYMNKAKCLEKGAFRNVLREIEILVELNHPFIVNLWYTFQDQEDMFMVFDLLLGGDLRYHLNQEGRLVEDRVKLYACEIALALDYLQRKEILHRDVKPDNIVLNDDGHAHLTDFNIATFLSEGSLATSMTGTRPYMAPEIYATSLHHYAGYSFAVDWWSLGICMYEMLRGRRPYEIHLQMTSRDASRVLTGTPLTIPVDWSDELVSFLGSLLDVDPDQRITNLHAFKSHPYMSRIQFNDVLRRRTAPVFIPPKESWNCDPTFELEEIIVESKPLHKKRKKKSTSLTREKKPELSKKRNSSPAPVDPTLEALQEMTREFKVYNREELLRNEEERIANLEEELGLRPPLEADAIAKRLGRLGSNA